MKTDVMLFTRDVEASSRWYQQLLGVKSGHGGPEYEMIVDDEGNLLFQFHHLEGDEHNVGIASESTARGAGVLIYVSVPNVREVHTRALDMGADVVSEPTFIELAGHTEFVVRDPDGYQLAVSTRGNV